MNNKVLLLVGSPKVKNSTSEVLGDYLLEQVQQQGVAINKIKVNQILQQEEGDEKLIAAVNECGLLIFSCPLYIDSAPAYVIRAMEIIAANRSEQDKLKKQSMLAICNCGFPEAHQNHTALAIYRCFARKAGFEWAGGLALGAGAAINGQPLAKMGGMVKNLVKALNLVADAIVEGKTVPEEAVKLIAKPMTPIWVYLLMGNYGWKFLAKKYGAHRKLKDRPYQT